MLKADQGDDNADQHKLNIADGGTLTLGSKISGSFVSYLTHTPNSTVASSTTAVAGHLTVGGDLTLGSGAVITEAELEAIDGVTAGTVTASKAVIVDSNKDIASFRNVTLTGELDAGSLDISGDADIDGTLEADAMTLNGTAITATATLDTGISNNNVPKFTSGVADDDFLRVAGTAIEGRSASEVLSDISAAPAAGSSNIVTTGALDSGSITSGFGSIDNGASAITTTGVITGGTLEATADTSAGDNAAIGYTAAEGLILTGQGSTSDVVIKNDADTTVCFVPTGTDDLKFNDNAALVFGTGDDFKISHNGSKTKLEDTGTGNLEIRGTNIEFYSGDGGETLAKLTDDGAAELYHNNTKRIETTAAGVSVTAGDASAPGYGFTTDTSSGMFLPGADTLAFSAGGTERVRIDSSGFVGLGTSAPKKRFHILDTTSDGIIILDRNGTSTDHQICFAHHYNTGSQTGGNFFGLGVDDDQNDFILAFDANSQASLAGDKIVRVTSGGNMAIDGSYSSGGADYAEYFEWSDGNSSSEDRRGYSVVLDGNKVRKATSDDAASSIVGVVSSTPAYIGDSAWKDWQAKYEKDDYANYVLENGERKLSSNFDDTKAYVPRQERKEWDAIGLMGKLRMRKGQPTGDRWLKLRDISDSVEEWLVR